MTCGNWRGITLMSTTAKVMGRILIMRITARTDAELRKVVEWNSSRYLCFVDYEKAFDSIHRSTL